MTRVCAVMITHDAGTQVTPVVRALMPQVDHIVVVDNASKAQDLAILQGLLSDSTRITLLRNEENRWMAAALNQGIAWAEARHYTHVLLSSDADVLSPNAVSTMLSAFKHATYGTVGSVNPRVILSDIPIEDPGFGGPRDIAFPVTGGCLLSIDAVREVGPQREDFLIDMVDFDYAIRLHKAGYRTLAVDSVSMAGELGRTTRRRFLWRHCDVHNYSPARRYYFTRNGLTLLRETRNLQLGGFYARFLIASLAKIALFEDQRRAKLRAIVMGLLDAARGRLGHRQL